MIMNSQHCFLNWFYRNYSNAIYSIFSRFSKQSRDGKYISGGKQQNRKPSNFKSVGIKQRVEIKSEKGGQS